MIKLHVLTQGFVSPNGRAFLFPLIMHRHALKDAGIDLQLFDRDDEEEKLCDCDVLIIESKFYSDGWKNHSDKILEKFERFKSKVSKLVYFAIGDSSGYDHAKVLPFVDVYAKNQLLKDRSLYLKPMYGNRIFSDYFHQKHGANDKNEEYSAPITDEKLLDKMTVGWNSGLADYSLHGPSRMALYYRIPFKPLLKFPKIVAKPSASRSNDISCRMGITYARDSVAWQRRKMREIMKENLATDKLSRGGYFKELANSKIILSPFGLGEITLKDFEVFLTGGLLIKPDMSHMETFPNLYQSGETIITHAWDLSNLEETIESALSDYNKTKQICQNGQENYSKYLTGKDTASLFVEHLKQIIF